MTLLATKTETSSVVGTSVAVTVAVVLAVAIGTGIGVSQWQQSNKAALTVEDLDVETTLDDDAIVLRDSGMAGSEYGRVVANAGDTNGDTYEDLLVTDVGSDTVYLYFGGATTLDTTVDWTMIGSDDFGYSAAGAGDVNADGYADVVIGARSVGTDAQGSVTMYYGSTTGPATTADWQVDGGEGGQYFGQTVAGIGDVSNDGYDDVAVFRGITPTYQSDVTVYYGGTTGPDTTSDWSYTSDNSFTEQSVNLASADVNGDGYADLIFGNPEINSSRGYGTLSVFHGSATGLPTRANFNALTSTDDYFGVTVSTAGDVNTDGYDDVIVTAPNNYNVESDEGALYVYYGSSSGLSRTRRIKIESNVSDAYLGIAATAVGDVDSNGYDDIAVTAPWMDRDGDGDQTGEGILYGGLSTGLVRRRLGATGAVGGMEEFGYSITASQSFIGTTTTDVVVGVGHYDDGTASGPAVIIYPDINL